MLIGEGSGVSYKIEYEGQNFAVTSEKHHKKLNYRGLAFLVLTVIVVIVWVITPVRTAVLDRILPGNGPVTRQAAGDMFQSLKDGAGFREAFTDFCIEIFENA